MIVLSEQYGYGAQNTLENSDGYAAVLGNKSYSKSIQRGKNKADCFTITYHQSEPNPYTFKTSYFVGVDWIVENELPIHVKPKLDEGTQEVDYLKMLFDTLKEPENFKHLDELCEIYFDKPSIPITQEMDLLTPLLVAQYLQVLKKIVQKGLKKSYYQVTKNLNAKIKGKIMINETIKKNQFNNKMLFNYCQYTEFGINSIENKILKKALTFSLASIQNLKGINVSSMTSLSQYIQPAFSNVDNEVNVNELKTLKPNKLYQEYEIALKLAKLLLKRYGYNISNINGTQINTPPFWIDMSKLFELYVYSKLKEKFTMHHEVTYHKKFNYLEPDFIINSNDGTYKMVVDAKYKPRYKENKVSTEDVRQISGYARLKKVYEYLNVYDDKVIDCLVIYSNQNANIKDFKGDSFKLTEEKEYYKFYKIGIGLPVK
ncbi:MAG: hypothetical protein QM534_10855 [Sediminibacterium sp.]|nr:hypothetical protein [Sediminibacterium sp.]